VTDALGQPLHFVLTGGQVHDVTQAETLLDGQAAEYVIADRGFASAALEAWLEARGILPVIPPHPRSHTPRWYDRTLYQERQAIECFFHKLKHYRRIFTRFDKLGPRYLSFVHLVSALLWLR
jgi:transposase